MKPAQVTLVVAAALVSSAVSVALTLAWTGRGLDGGPDGRAEEGAAGPAAVASAPAGPHLTPARRNTRSVPSRKRSDPLRTRSDPPDAGSDLPDVGSVPSRGRSVPLRRRSVPAAAPGGTDLADGTAARARWDNVTERFFARRHDAVRSQGMAGGVGGGGAGGVVTGGETAAPTDGDGDGPVDAAEIAEAFAGLDVTAQREEIQHTLNLLDHAELSAIDGIFLDAETDGEVLDIIFNNVLNRPPEAKAAALGKVAAVPGHPYAARAAEFLLYTEK